MMVLEVDGHASDDADFVGAAADVRDLGLLSLAGRRGEIVPLLAFWVVIALGCTLWLLFGSLMLMWAATEGKAWLIWLPSMPLFWAVR